MTEEELRDFFKRVQKRAYKYLDEEDSSDPTDRLNRILGWKAAFYTAKVILDELKESGIELNSNKNID